MVDICHYIFVKTHVMHNTKVNPDVNYGLEYVSALSHQCNKRAALMQMAIKGKTEESGETI